MIIFLYYLSNFSYLIKILLTKLNFFDKIKYLLMIIVVY